MRRPVQRSVVVWVKPLLDLGGAMHNVGPIALPEQSRLFIARSKQVKVNVVRVNVCILEIPAL